MTNYRIKRSHKSYSDYLVDCLCAKYCDAFYRVVDKRMRESNQVTSGDIHFVKDSWRNCNGWGKPHIEVHGLEIRYYPPNLRILDPKEFETIKQS